MHSEIEGINKALMIANGVMAIVGGLARALSDKKRQWVDIVISMIIAGFTGSMAGLIVMYFFGDQHAYLTLACSGSFGFAGEKGMYWLLSIIKKSIKANLPE